MFNILARTRRRIKKLCEYHTRKADRFEKLAAYYTEKARQHRTASKAYMDAATTLEIETLDVSDCVTAAAMGMTLEDLGNGIAAATKRNDENIARTGDMKMSDAFKAAAMPSPFTLRVDGQDLLYYAPEIGNHRVRITR